MIYLEISEVVNIDINISQLIAKQKYQELASYINQNKNIKNKNTLYYLEYINNKVVIKYTSKYKEGIIYFDSYKKASRIIDFMNEKTIKLALT